MKEQLQRLLPDYVVMTDAIGSTEGGMNGIRVVTKGDVAKEGITSVQASADSVVLDEDPLPEDEPVLDLGAEDQPPRTGAARPEAADSDKDYR